MAKKGKKTPAQIDLDFKMQVIKDNPEVARGCLRQAGITKAMVQKGRVTNEDIRRLARCMSTKTVQWNPKRYRKYLRDMKSAGGRVPHPHGLGKKQ